tara:strand:- start:2370 stop:4142 length:1773 start_codon:yes stop_codon:yes gene_type:complete
MKDIKKINNVWQLFLTEGEEGSEKKFDAEEFYKTALAMFKPPTELAGKLDTEERSFFQKYITNNIVGKTLPDKIAQLNVLMESTEDVDADDTPLNYILSSLGALKILQETIDDFNESTAGFTFEAFLSGLLGGKQVTDKVGGTLPIEDCMFFVDPKTGEGGQPVSLKLLTGTGGSTLVKGSIKNLLDFFQRPDVAAVANEKGIEYIVAVKFSDKGLGIYSFNIKPSNFFNWVEESAFDFSRLKAAPEEEELSEQEEDDKLAAMVARFKKGVGELMPMMGLSREFEPNIENIRSGKLKPFKQQIIPFPSVSLSNKKKIAEITNMINYALSDEGRTAYDKFLQMPKPGDRPKYEEATTIPEEYVDAWRENPQSAIKDLAKILKNRHTYLKDAIEKISALEDASILPLMGYAGKYVKKSYDKKDIVEYLHTLGSSNDAEDIINWSKIVKGMMTSTQFHIALRRVITEGTDYGTITFDKKKILKIIEAYADVLKVQVAPVYKSFAYLNQSINSYFIENKPGSAGKASEWAVKLQKDVDELPPIKDYADPTKVHRGGQGKQALHVAPEAGGKQYSESKDNSLKENKNIKLILKRK